ncbi:MAG TPA: hypothetical protein VFM14_05840, partial [Gemmatimonadales bacterium]|nr:hypothetical protein [Gemmatimonadales bacterium]
MPSADVTGLVFDWNGELKSCPDVAINDETLRDGLQAPSVREPPGHLKQRLIHLMPALGIDAATLGFPAAGPRMLAQCRLLAREVATARLPLALNCAARTLESDLRPIVELANGTGLTIEAGAFIRASAVGQTVGRQRLDQMLAAVEQAVGFGVRNGLAVMFVAEDGSRAHPDTLAALCRAAVRAGARRLCVADTTGFATPAGTARLVRFIRERVIAPSGAAIALDWHGHRDRGLAVANCLAAAAAGVDRVHATALG